MTDRRLRPAHTTLAVFLMLGLLVTGCASGGTPAQDPAGERWNKCNNFSGLRVLYDPSEPEVPYWRPHVRFPQRVSYHRASARQEGVREASGTEAASVFQPVPGRTESAAATRAARQT